jgi:outer membrane protein TolC
MRTFVKTGIALIVIFTFLFSVLSADDTALKPLTFQDCLKTAKQNSYDYKIQSEKAKQATLAKFKAIGGLLPEISLEHTRDYGVPSAGAGAGIIQYQGWESELVAVQPVFHGLEKLTSISYYDRLEAREELNLSSTERQLSQDTASAFFALASAQADMSNIQEALDLLNKRVKELRGWLNLGKSRPSEVYAAESADAVTASQLEDAKAAVASAVDRLALIMGVEDVIIQQPVETDASGLTVDVAAVVNNRSEVKALQAALEAQGRLIEMGAGAFLPQVDLSAAKLLGGTPYLGATAYKDTGWEFALTANWPVFEGGARVFDSIAALSAEESIRQQLKSEIAVIKYEIKSRVRDLAASENSVRVLKDAYDKSSKSLTAQEHDYEYGLVTNIDVLQAMSTAESVKQSLDREIMQKEMNKVLLGIAVEQYK